MNDSSIRKLVLGLVWGTGDPRDFDSGMIAGRCFRPRPYASLVKNFKAFPRGWSMILWCEVHCQRPNEVGERRRRGAALYERGR